MPSSTRSVGRRLYCWRGPRSVRAQLCHPLRKRYCSAGFRADVFIAFHIREGSVPTQEYEILTAWLAQPPMVGFALQVQAMVALVWRAYFHALPSSCFCQQTSHISPSMRLSLISLWGRSGVRSAMSNLSPQCASTPSAQWYASGGTVLGAVMLHLCCRLFLKRFTGRLVELCWKWRQFYLTQVPNHRQQADSQTFEMTRNRSTVSSSSRKSCDSENSAQCS
jgi:hypothetical protein